MPRLENPLFWRLNSTPDRPLAHVRVLIGNRECMPTEKAETAMVKPPTDGTIIDAATPLKNATPIVASVAPRSALTAASALPPLQTNGNSDQPASPPMPSCPPTFRPIV